MTRLLILLIGVALLAFFAFQNQNTVPLNLAGFSIVLPVAFVALATAALGFLVGLALAVPNYFDRRRIDPMEQMQAAIDRLNQKLTSLEDENASLREEHDNYNRRRDYTHDEREDDRPSLLKRLTH